MSRRIVLVDIGNALAISGVLPSVALFGAYSALVAARGGAAPYSYTIVAGALPAGLQLDPTTGIVSGSSVTQAGTFAVTIRATDVSGRYVQRQFAVVVIAEPLSLTGAATPWAVGTPYSYTYTVSGGAPPYTWSVASGALPAGLVLDNAGTISGTPTAASAPAWVIRVTDSEDRVAELADNTVLQLLGTFADATVGKPYTGDLAISGGDGIYSNARVIEGALPDGLALSIVGDKLRLRGTPTTKATNTFTVAADSTDGQTATSDQSIDVIVALVPVAFDPTYAYSDVVLANQNYTASRSGGGYKSVYGTTSKSAGKWQIEARVTAIGGTVDLGVADKIHVGTGGDTRGVLASYCGDVNSEGQYSCGIWTIDGNAYLFRNDRTTLINSKSAGSLATGDYLSACVDLDAGTIAFYRNGAMIAGTNVTLAASIWFPCASFGGGGSLSLTNGPLVHPIAGYSQWG